MFMKKIYKKKIFIVGSEGFLGRSLKNKIKQINDYSLIIHKKKQKIDFSNSKDCKKILEIIQPDIIINCAAKTNINFCEKNKKIAYKSNAIVVKNLSHYCKRNNLRLIQISTDHIYNNKTKSNTEKSSSIKNYYSYSKLKGEHFAKKCNSLILRVNFFGQDKKNNDSLVNWIINSSKKKLKINLFKDVYFSPLYIQTLISIICKLLESNENGIFNIGSKNKISKSNFILAVAKKLKIKLNYNLINYQDLKESTARRPTNMSMNINKFQKKFLIKLPKVEDEIKKLFFK